MAIREILVKYEYHGQIWYQAEPLDTITITMGLTHETTASPTRQHSRRLIERHSDEGDCTLPESQSGYSQDYRQEIDRSP